LAGEGKVVKSLLTETEVAELAKQLKIAETNRTRIREAARAGEAEKTKLRELLSAEQANAIAKNQIIDRGNQKRGTAALRAQEAEAMAAWVGVKGYGAIGSAAIIAGSSIGKMATAMAGVVTVGAGLAALANIWRTMAVETERAAKAALSFQKASRESGTLV